MTREEAKTILRETSVTPDMHPDSIGKYLDAMKMAIEALEQQPKTGHWNNKPDDPEGLTGLIYCSECGGVCMGWRFFCSRCGAKMDNPL